MVSFNSAIGLGVKTPFQPDAINGVSVIDRRGRVGIIAVGIMSSFFAFLLSLLLAQVINTNAYVIFAIVGLMYSCIMSNANAFDGRQ